MTSSTAGTARAARAALRGRLATIAPGGVLWLVSEGLAHPEATRFSRLPFPFVVGRLAHADGPRTVREIELVADVASTDLATELDRYARFVIMTTPTIHARLNGRAHAAWRVHEGQAA